MNETTAPTPEERAAEVLAAHGWRHTATTHCICGWRSPLAQLAVEGYYAHVAAALAEAGLLADLHTRKALLAQREAIVDRLEDAALDVLSKRGDEGAALVAAVLRQAAEIARWAHPQEVVR